MKFKQKNGYDCTKYRTEYNGYTKKEYQEKLTEPGQAVTVKQLVERYERQAKGKARKSNV